MTAITKAPARPQCPRCSRYMVLGGMVLPPEPQCAALDAVSVLLGVSALAVLQRCAFDLANRGRCPNFNPLSNHPDAYRALDLPRK